MRTSFVTPKEYGDAILKLVEENMVVGEHRPENFIKAMKENQGYVNWLKGYGVGADGQAQKNPVVVVLGDSVTAGHFEMRIFIDTDLFFEKLAAGGITEADGIEITDSRDCYPEQFRRMLVDHFERTSVSVINAGIAGDTIEGMQKRLYRDVIRYQPELVIVNGSLNWDASCGSTAIYKKRLQEVVKALKAETKSDIVLLTPNKMVLPAGFENPESSLDERVDVIRQTAGEENVCLADVYRIWELYEQAGYPLDKLLSNGINHPSLTGHTVYAKALMQLMKE